MGICIPVSSSSLTAARGDGGWHGAGVRWLVCAREDGREGLTQRSWERRPSSPPGVPRGTLPTRLTPGRWSSTTVALDASHRMPVQAQAGTYAFQPSAHSCSASRWGRQAPPSPACRGWGRSGGRNSGGQLEADGGAGVAPPRAHGSPAPPPAVVAARPPLQSALELLVPGQLVRNPWRWAAVVAAGWRGDGPPLLAWPSSSPACSLGRELPAGGRKAASLEAGAEAGPPSSPAARWREAEDGSRSASTTPSPRVVVFFNEIHRPKPRVRGSQRRRRSSRAPPAAACCFARDSVAAPMGLFVAARPSLLSPPSSALMLCYAREVVGGLRQVVGLSQPGGGPPSRQIRRRRGSTPFSRRG
jgi:hypothetical protein